MSPVLLAAVLAALVALLIKFARSRPPNFPPGPLRLPIVGGYLHIRAYNYRYSHKALRDMSASYKSPVLGLYVGSDPTIVTNDLESTRELLQKPEFQGRPNSFEARLRSFGDLYGIFFVDGPFWAEQRSFSLRYLRDFGFGRRFPKQEFAVEEEIRIAMDVLQSPIGAEEKTLVQGAGAARRALLPDVLYPGFVNAFLEVVTGERFPRERHGQLRALSRSVRLFQRHVEPSGGLLNISPWIRHVFPGLSRYRGFVQGNQGVLDFIRGLEADSRQSFDSEALRGFLDVFLHEIKKRRDELSGFTDKQLVMLVLDYIFPSATVPPVTVSMAIAYLVQHPDKADRAHREIVAVVGRDRLPTLDDRPGLPYTEAILREVLRKDTNTALSIPHRCTEDTTFRGYSIPKGTLLIPNIWAADRDPAVWDRGDEFIPERFLDPTTGRLSRDVSVPFGLGRRLCAGETFSRNTMFLYLSALIQNFSFSVPDGGYLPSEDDMIPGVLVTPKSFWVTFEPRP